MVQPGVLPTQFTADMAPKVSVVTPAFNAMPYLKETIESILAQNYPNLEHIVMDGGSGDGTVALLRQYPHIIWASEPDRGQSHALNKAFQRASGEIIGWLNADDTYQPGAIAAAVAFLQAHPDVDLVYSDQNIIDEQGQVVGLSEARPFDLNQLLLDNLVKQPTIFMRRRVIESLKGVDERYHYVMDRELWLRAGVRFRFHYLAGQRLANFRLIPGTKTFENTPQFRAEWIQVIEKASQDPDFQSIPERVKQQALQSARAGYLVAHGVKCLDDQKGLAAAQYFFKAGLINKALFLNRGFWLFLVYALLGRRRDKTTRFRKNSGSNNTPPEETS